MLQRRGTQEAIAIEPWVIGGKYRAQLKRRTFDSTSRLRHAFRLTHCGLEGRGNQDVVFSAHGSSSLWPLSQPKGFQATLCRPAHGYLDQGTRPTASGQWEPQRLEAKTFILLLTMPQAAMTN
jgi:hypothetical protein